ncbi:hypothetical protein [Salinimicrobium sediminilitoris]|uniref:hypothetical protein n=1 Tax=Salinimicrobium sediminilitoris TaxID=2876715 RepID=UPI001E5DF7AF|nr:hypothetical protein [Salinimicrobium sediminilitoris]MCC8359629.1 hypothetical protein [Salinimicrobium sediminilitoris]
MKIDKLKLELLEEIINCNDASTLKKVEEIFRSYPSIASETEEEYNLHKEVEFSEALNISPEQEEELMRRYDDHLKNGGESIPREVVKRNLRDLDDF